MPACFTYALILSFFLVPLSTFAAVNASQTLILQTGGTERARFNTLGLITASISATEVSTSVIKWGTRTPPTCNAAANGQMLYTTSATAPLQFCDGSAWRVITLDGSNSNLDLFTICNGAVVVAADTCSYSTAGSYSIVIPPNRSVIIKAWGAGGGVGGNASWTAASGGAGGFTQGTLPSTGSYRSFKIIVGAGAGSKGGDYSGFFLNTVSQANAYLVAGGGGAGGTTNSGAVYRFKGGAAGYPAGMAGTENDVNIATAQGGTQSAAGSSGGAALADPPAGIAYGGKGYYGGGANGSSVINSGGGGSGFIHASLTDTSYVNSTTYEAPATADPHYISGTAVGFRGSALNGGGNGLVVITFQ